jgi:hypothetical protein
MSEEEAIQEMMAMSDEELLLVPHTVVKWICQAKGCNRHTKAKDYGIAPTYFHAKMKGRWQDLSNTFFLCGKHWKLYQRLIKRFDISAVQHKIFDYKKRNIINL